MGAYGCANALQDIMRAITMTITITICFNENYRKLTVNFS